MSKGGRCWSAFLAMKQQFTTIHLTKETFRETFCEEDLQDSTLLKLFAPKHKINFYMPVSFGPTRGDS